MAPRQQLLFDMDGSIGPGSGLLNKGLFIETVFDGDMRRPALQKKTKLPEETLLNVSKLRRPAKGVISIGKIQAAIAGDEDNILIDTGDLLYQVEEKPVCCLRAGNLTDVETCRLIERSLDLGIEWAVLTDGERWRLFRTLNLCPPKSYLELSTQNITAKSKNDEALAFIHFFTPFFTRSHRPRWERTD